MRVDLIAWTQVDVDRISEAVGGFTRDPDASDGEHLIESAGRQVPNATLADRLWAKVDKNGPWILDTQCWVWTGYICKETGYGKISNSPGNPISTHVAAFLVTEGRVPPGKYVLHECDYRPCVRHIYAGTQKQNAQDMLNRGRFVDWKEDIVLCPQGHNYDTTDSEGYRACSTCKGFQSRQVQIVNRARLGKRPRSAFCKGCAYAVTNCKCQELRLGAYLPVGIYRKLVSA